MHRYTVQCVLPLNMLNEKIFIVLWFWIHGLLISTCVNIVQWAVQLLVSSYRIEFLAELKATAEVGFLLTACPSRLIDRPLVGKNFWKKENYMYPSKSTQYFFKNGLGVLQRVRSVTAKCCVVLVACSKVVQWVSRTRKCECKKKIGGEGEIGLTSLEQ